MAVAKKSEIPTVRERDNDCRMFRGAGRVDPVSLLLLSGSRFRCPSQGRLVKRVAPHSGLSHFGFVLKLRIPAYAFSTALLFG